VLLTIVRGVTNGWERLSWRRECNKYSVEECYRHAEEARRLANTPGIAPEEKADLLKVEQTWLWIAYRESSEEM
jgi:hypothetical protein